MLFNTKVIYHANEQADDGVSKKAQSNAVHKLSFDEPNFI